MKILNIHGFTQDYMKRVLAASCFLTKKCPLKESTDLFFSHSFKPRSDQQTWQVLAGKKKSSKKKIYYNNVLAKFLQKVRIKDGIKYEIMNTCECVLKKKKNRKKGGTPKGHVEICEHEDTENSSSFNNPSPFFGYNTWKN